MRALKVVLFINFALWILFGLFDLFFPAQLAQMGMGQDPLSARHVAAIVIGLSIVIWYAFRDPAGSAGVVNALIILYSIDFAVGLYQSINGIELWKNTITGMVLNVVLGIALVMVRPRGENR